LEVLLRWLTPPPVAQRRAARHRVPRARLLRARPAPRGARRIPPGLRVHQDHRVLRIPRVLRAPREVRTCQMAIAPIHRPLPKRSTKQERDMAPTAGSCRASQIEPGKPRPKEERNSTRQRRGRSVVLEGLRRCRFLNELPLDLEKLTVANRVEGPEAPSRASEAQHLEFTPHPLEIVLTGSSAHLPFIAPIGRRIKEKKSQIPIKWRAFGIPTLPIPRSHWQLAGGCPAGSFPAQKRAHGRRARVGHGKFFSAHLVERLATRR
jgi:hypothetical protein